MDDSLSAKSFFKGARKAAHKALHDHGRPEYDEFALHAGLAVEKLAKAVLVSKNPAYIAEPRNEDMLLHFGGHLSVDEDKVRTVGAKDAIARLRRIGVLRADSQLDLLIALRNGAAHAAPNSTLVKGMISPLARTIEALLNDLGKALDEFWGRWTKAVRDAVNEQEDQVFRDVQLRITQARHAFEDRFKYLPPGSKELVLTEQQLLSYPWMSFVENDADGIPFYSTSGDDCPSCGGPGTLTFAPTEVTATDTHYRAHCFACSLCSFEVVGPDEMAALRKANTPPTINSLVVSHSQTLPPVEVAVLKAKTV
ncbi:hypothetical protein F9278_04435 [Streptomyces phaeolivaceus]|uniref:Uncharacterized protein n=1 Tax=Streptomyces phaeolivaceus TaxID=2653200 RepID=A0A5P8JYJ0_9ACTN|nr:hypothetical protein [Streptomyces phaeolivaceus]QFQ95558.1 hypothetical protein F9278_04435 [Streptomyces phaeolivaceus]